MYPNDAFFDVFLDALKCERSSILLIGFRLGVDALTPLWFPKISVVPNNGCRWDTISTKSVLCQQKSKTTFYIMLPHAPRSHLRSYILKWRKQMFDDRYPFRSYKAVEEDKTCTESLVYNSELQPYRLMKNGLPGHDLYSFLHQFNTNLNLALDPCQSS